MIGIIAEAAQALGMAPAGLITADLLLRLGWVDPEQWASALSPAAARHGITTPARLAMALANFAHETDGGRRLDENLNYSPEALLAQWPKHFTAETAAALGRTPGHPADQRGIACAAYDGRMGNCSPGDGWTFRGAGLLQATGRDWFGKLAMVTKRPIADLPAWLLTRDGAAESGCALWEWMGCNKLADAGDVVRCRLVVNGGAIGLDDVKARWVAAKTALGVV